MKDRPDDARGVTAANGTTKARIERAALLLFAERGIDAVTTREIAAASGVSEGALYRHYSGKEQLAETMFFAIHERLASDIRTAGQSSKNIDKLAIAIVAAYCRIADDDWALFSYHLLSTHRFLPRPGKSRRRKHDDPVSETEDIIETAMLRGDIADGDHKLKAAMALGVVLQTALHKIYGRITGELSAHQNALTKAVLAALKA